MEKEVVEVATRAKEKEEVKKAKVDVELSEDTVTLKIIINKRECVVLY